MIDWKQLKIGDQVKVIEWPRGIRRETLHSETAELYDWLISTHGILKIIEIQDGGIPIGKIYRNKNGEQRSEYLALNHQGLKRLTKHGK